MQFPGYWVDGTGDAVSVEYCVFDDTELSAESGWKQAHQNDDQEAASGFVDPVEMLREVAQRLLAGDGDTAGEDSQIPLRRGEPARVQTVRDLALLILAEVGGAGAATTGDHDVER